MAADSGVLDGAFGKFSLAAVSPLASPPVPPPTPTSTPVKSFPRIHPEVAFADGPWATPTVWTNLVNFVRDDGEFRVSRGSTNEFSKFQAGKLDNLVLDNRGRTFDPTFASGAPYQGNVIPSKQVALNVEYPWLPGLLPEDNLRNSTLGVNLGAASGLVGTSVAFDRTQGYITPLQSVKVTITNAAANGGLPYVSLGAIPIKPGQALLAKVAARCSVAGRTFEFNTQWYSSVPTLLSQTYPETEGVYTAVAANTWYGQSLISQQGVAAPTSAAWAFPLIHFPSATNGDVWWIDAVVVDYCSLAINAPLITAYVDDWHLEYKGRDSTCKLSASDALATFGIKDIVGTGYESTVLALPNLRHYWSLGQPSSYTQATLPEDGPNGGVAAIKYFAAFGVPGPVLTDLTTAVGITDDQTLAIGGWFDLGALATPQPGVGWTVGWWFQMNAYTDRMFCLGDTNDINSLILPTGATFPDMQFLSVYTGQMPGFPGAFNVVGSYTTIGNVNSSFGILCTPPPVKKLGPNGLWDGGYIAGNAWDGAWHFFCMSRGADNQTFSFYLDGVQITPQIQAGVGNGSLSGQNVIPSGGTMPFPANEKSLLGGSNDTPGFTGQLAHFFVMDGVITPSAVSNLYNMAQNQWFGQTPGSRVNAVLNALGFPSALRNIDTGTSTFEAEVESLAQQNSLQYLQTIEDSENGWLFMDRFGNVRLMARANMIKAPGNTPKWVVGDLWPQNMSVELPVTDTKLDNSNNNIYTEAEGSRKNGSTLYVYGSQLVNQGKRSISLSNLLNASDQEVLNILNYRVSMYQNPQLRITQVVIQPEGVDELWQFVLQVEIGDVVKINVRPEPAGSTPLTQVGRVRQVQHSVGRKRWKTTLDLAAVDVQQYFVLDDPVLGKLDNGNRLAY